jgi:hypothetical protein
LLLESPLGNYSLDTQVHAAALQTWNAVVRHDFSSAAPAVVVASASMAEHRIARMASSPVLCVDVRRAVSARGVRSRSVVLALVSLHREA